MKTNRRSRIPVALATLILLASCTESESAKESDSRLGSDAVTPVPGPPAVAYAAASFRSDVERLITNKQYTDTVAYLTTANPKQLASHDSEGYLAVALDMILLPGIDIDYSRSRDWVFPGTSDCIESSEWQNAATAFAEQYNLFRRSGD